MMQGYIVLVMRQGGVLAGMTNCERERCGRGAWGGGGATFGWVPAEEGRGKGVVSFV